MARSSSKAKQHHHGCTKCRRRYCCSCLSEEPGLCNVCLSGRETAASRAWDPQPCCLANEPLPLLRTAEQRKPYLLSGTPWFKCPTCARQFPVQPSQVKVR